MGDGWQGGLEPSTWMVSTAALMAPVNLLAYAVCTPGWCIAAVTSSAAGELPTGA
eukprot:SAG31_NODE_590_length_13794_cov_22.123695_5_plen_55_part_00